MMSKSASEPVPVSSPSSLPFKSDGLYLLFIEFIVVDSVLGLEHFTDHLFVCFFFMHIYNIIFYHQGTK